MPRAAKSSHSLELGEQERLTAQTLACRWCVWACRIEKARTAVEEFSLEGHPGQCVLHSEENSAHANNTPTHLRCETRQLGRPQTAALFLESLPCRKAIWPPTSLYDSATHLSRMKRPLLRGIAANGDFHRPAACSLLSPGAPMVTLMLGTGVHNGMLDCACALRAKLHTLHKNQGTSLTRQPLGDQRCAQYWQQL